MDQHRMSLPAKPLPLNIPGTVTTFYAYEGGPARNALLAAFNNPIALPTKILYDSEGKEVWRVAGGVEWDDTEMAKLLREAD